MRLYSHHDTQPYIHSLATAINRDPASLHEWLCVRVQPFEPAATSQEALERLAAENPRLECDMIACDDGDLLLISRSMDAAALRQFSDVFSGPDLAVPPALTFYELFADWRAVRALLFSKRDPQFTPAAQPRIEVPLGEMAAFSEVFAAARRRRQSRQPQHVLVVEDDALTRRMVTGAFKDRYAIISATCAQEAMSNYLLYAPDIVFLDIGLPDASGFDVLHQIIASDPDAYVIMFSADQYLDTITTALEAGASGFIGKPFRKEMLHHYIEDSMLHHCKQA